MRAVTFLRQQLLLLFVCLLPVDGRGGDGYAACQQEEQRLQAAVAEQCSGLPYFLNPSACFNTRKALAPYGKGKCRDIAAAEGGAKQVEPAAAAALPVQPPAAAVAVPALPVQPQLSSGRKGGSASPPTEIEQLRIDIEKLREELQRLEAELIRYLRK